jgi:hypothetical protein
MLWNTVHNKTECNTLLFVMHIKTKLMLYLGETKTLNRNLCACVHEC